MTAYCGQIVLLGAIGLDGRKPVSGDFKVGVGAGRRSQVIQRECSYADWLGGRDSQTPCIVTTCIFIASAPSVWFYDL
jgi:hypothetical protein